MILPLRLNPSASRSAVARKAGAARAALRRATEGAMHEIGLLAEKHGISSSMLHSTGQLYWDPTTGQIEISLSSSKWSLHGADKPGFIKDLKALAKKVRPAGVSLSVGVLNNPSESGIPARPPWVVLDELRRTGEMSVFELVLTTDREGRPVMLLAVDQPEDSSTATLPASYWAVAQEGDDYRSAVRGRKTWEGFEFPLPSKPGPISVRWGYATGPGMDQQYELGRSRAEVTADQLAAVRR